MDLETFLSMLIHFWGFCLAAKNRGIAIPVDLDSQVNALFSKSQIVMKHTRQWLNAGRSRRDSTMTISRDYRSIIEGLQVRQDLKEYIIR